MGVGSWLKSMFKTEKRQINDTSIEPIPILRMETPEKIVETKIKPVKIPTIMDIGERLGLISHDLTDLKREMVSKSWFKTEYEDSSPEIIDKLEKIESKLSVIQESLVKPTVLTKAITKPSIVKLSYPETLNIQDKILDMIQKEKKIRYKDIATELPVSDPTLCKYLKKLLTMNRITKRRVGKAVYYEPV